MSIPRKSIQKTAAARRPLAKTPAKPPSKPPLVRGDAVVQRVLDAAIQELAHVGFRGFRIEDVATRAEVNKTTVYRRWPSKKELVREALATASAKKRTLPNTGSLRSDLLAFASIFREYAHDPLGQSLFRMLVAESSEPELFDILESLRAEHEKFPKLILANAAARGEITADVDHQIFFSAFFGALHHRLFFLKKDPDEVFLTSLIDMLLRGATPRTVHPALQNAPQNSPLQ